MCWGGFMSAYFVITALTTVRPASAWTRRLDSGALVVALALALIEIGLGFRALASPARVAQILPEPFTTAPMRALPVALVFVAMFYWLWRVRARRTLALR
jgi:hypothetical protein